MANFVGLIGLGYWGRNHARILSELYNEGLIEKVVFIEKIKKRAQEFGERYGFNYYTSIEKAITKEDLDSVIIATPADTHYELITKLDSEYNGVDIFVEKPVIAKSKEGELLLEKINNRSIMVGHIFRFHKALKVLKDDIKNHSFGRIYYIDIIRRSLREPRPDVGALHSLAIHDFDLIPYLIDDSIIPSNINGNSLFLNNRDIDVHSIINIKYSSFFAHLEESWLDPTIGKKRLLKIVGSNRSAQIDLSQPGKITYFETYISDYEKENNIKIHSDGKNEKNFNYEEPLKEEIRHFIIESSKNKNYIANLKHGLRSVVLCDISLESSKTMKPISPRQWIQDKRYERLSEFIFK